jgi:N-acetylglucosaminyl-diphospho-decaprenol L-rhamnosyltransferase
MSAVDVVVVAYGSTDHLRACLTALGEHPPAGGASIVVVDNGPGDEATSVVRSGWPGAEVIVSGRNAGFAAAANAGISRGAAPAVLVLNPDTIVLGRTVDHVLAVLDDHPEVGIVGCRLERADGTFDHAARRSFPTPLSAFAHLTGLGRRARRGPLAQYRAPEVSEGQVDAVNGAFMLIRRAALEKVGGFDEGYWMYMEDLDLCYRFAQAGWSTWYEPGATAIHLKGATAVRARSPRLTIAFYRSMARFVRQHPEVVRPALLRPVVYAVIALLGAAAATAASCGKIPGWIVGAREKTRNSMKAVLHRFMTRQRPPVDR